MAATVPDHLRRDETRSTAKRPPRRIAVGSEPFCEPKVRNFDAHVRVKKEVRWLDVAVQNALLMNIREPVKDLPAVVLCLAFADSSSLLEHVLQRLPTTAVERAVSLHQ